ncbi:MAG: protein kinase [Chloroflexi bacterium]|nr:protein kinase [Chloroflexota bacterium]
MRCPTCNTLNPAGAPFCAECGTRLVTSPGPPSVPPTGALPQQMVLQGRYVIEQKLGQGGMGAVYRARDLRLSTVTWAIKEMSQSQITGPLELQQARVAFQQEAELLAGLSHPGLPRVVDHFEQDGKAYLVMEFVPGGSLLAIAQREGLPLPLPRVLDWARQICDVLEYLHSRPSPIIFRDLKPANVMLTPEGQVKLIDFGIARLFKPGKERDTQAFGTMGYSAPEQYGRGQTDARSDVYSLGVLLHQLLTGYDPTSTPFRLPPARQVNTSLPAHVSDAIARAVDPNPEARFPGVAAFRDALMAGEQVMLRPVSRPIETDRAYDAASQQVSAQNVQPAPIGGDSTLIANAGRWVGIGSVALMALAALIVGIEAARGDSGSALAGFAYIVAFIPLLAGPVAFVLGMIALVSPVTAQTVHGRRHATIAVVTGVATLLLCCGIFGLAGTTNG